MNENFSGFIKYVVTIALTIALLAAAFGLYSFLKNDKLGNDAIEDYLENPAGYMTVNFTGLPYVQLGEQDGYYYLLTKAYEIPGYVVLKQKGKEPEVKTSIAAGFNDDRYSEGDRNEYVISENLEKEDLSNLVTTKIINGNKLDRDVLDSSSMTVIDCSKDILLNEKQTKESYYGKSTGMVSGEILLAIADLLVIIVTMLIISLITSAVAKKKYKKKIRFESSSR